MRTTVHDPNQIEGASAGLTCTDPDATTTDRTDLETWPSGAILLGEYRVIRKLGEGGMGAVHLVETLLDPDVRYAIKTIKSGFTDSPVKRKDFLRELRNWMVLPGHPNLTRCLFFRSIGERLGVFTDYIDGGTLSAWITEHRLMDMHDILDVAIQIAQGLQSAHSRGVIHMDMKPGNILMTNSGEARITDFGLAKSLILDRIHKIRNDAGARALENVRGLTLAYCSPEQLSQNRVTYKTDMWSYAVSILEIFTGKPIWRMGILAPLSLEQILAKGAPSEFPSLPESLGQILRKCMQENPSDRLNNMNEVIIRLLDLFKEITGSSYFRPTASIKKDRSFKKADHERISIEGMRWEDPEVWIARARCWLGQTSSETEATPQIRRISQNAMRIFDLERYEEASQLFQQILKQHGNEALEDYCKMLTEKAIVHQAIADEPGMILIYDRIIALLEPNLYARQNAMLFNLLTKTSTNKGLLMYNQNRLTEACDLFDRAIAMLDEKLETDSALAWRRELARCTMNKGNCLMYMGRLEESAGMFDKAVWLLEVLIDQKGQTDLLHVLAMAMMNRAVVLGKSGKNKESIDVYEKVISIMEPLVKGDGQSSFVIPLVKAYLNSSKTMDALGMINEAARLNDKALSLMEQLYFHEGKNDFSGELAHGYLRKADVLLGGRNTSHALAILDKATDIIEQRIFIEGRNGDTPLLAEAYITKGNMLIGQGSPEKATSWIQRGMKILERELSKNPSYSLIELYSSGSISYIETLLELTLWREANRKISRVVSILQRFSAEKQFPNAAIHCARIESFRQTIK